MFSRPFRYQSSEVVGEPLAVTFVSGRIVIVDTGLPVKKSWALPGVMFEARN